MQRYVAGPERVLGKLSRVQLVRGSLREESRQLYLQDVPLDKLPELGYCSGASSVSELSGNTACSPPNRLQTT